ncbi:DUF5916 domain-containing protein [Fodinibius sediminis]|uniref:DUF5916 domain-containing protein n=1 Tax=Fodinibius sediminis TaxID=1214077 RepID=A0A521D6X4_9BACT|nr:DUF5916 domain-containing protein [Fodinibius sediminis]SMO66831.1 hypothetical protein SAMN06265218_108161 [Fodinibius sediminis]
MKSVCISMVLVCLAVTVYAQSPDDFNEYEYRRAVDNDIRKGSAAAPRMEARRIDPESEIILDGFSSDSVWEHVPVASGFTQRKPDDGAPATMRTEVKMVYTDTHVYVAMKAFDSAPDSIVAPLFRRDGDEASDWFHIAFDSYSDRRTAFVFGVNPRGVQRDFMITDNSNEDSSWDAVWQAQARLVEDGWVAEMKIPLSQLRFSSRSDVQQWGINFQRSVARSGEEAFWAPTPQSSSGIVSNFGTLEGIRQLKEPRRLEVMPYISADITRSPRESTGNPYYQQNSFSGNVGGDLKYGITSDLTLSATINPDFGQVEGDPAVINLTANENFFEEKRPFFLEGRDIFQFGRTRTFIRYTAPTPFYSRRIGRNPQGDRTMAAIDGEAYVDRPDFTTIAGAAKLSGKTQGGWSLGFLDAYTLKENARFSTPGGAEESFAVEPATNYLVGRAKKDFNNGNSFVGGFASGVNRSISDTYFSNYLHSSAYLGGVDYEHRFWKNNWIASGAFSYSSVNGSRAAVERTQKSPVRYFNRVDSKRLSVDANRSSLNGFATELSLQKRGGEDHWLGALTYTEISPGYEANDLGFLTRSDLRWMGGVLAYRETSPRHVEYYEFFGGYDRGWNYDGDLIRNSMMVGGFVRFHNLWSFNFNLGQNFKQYTDRVSRGGPVMERPRDWNLVAEINSNPNKTVSFNMGGNLRREVAGELDNAVWASLKVKPIPSMQLDISPRYGYARDIDQYVRRVEDSGADHTYGYRYVFADIGQHTLSTSIRLNWTFSTRMSLQTYVRLYFASGDYHHYKELAEPRTVNFARYGEDRGNVVFDGEKYQVNPDGTDNGNTFSFANPDFNFRSIQGNAVFRWEYAPGSTLYLVWQQQRQGTLNVGDFNLSRDVDALFQTRATNVFLVKLSYWFGK